MRPNHPLFLLLVVLSACATAPKPSIHDKLDAATEATVTVLPSPLELLTPPERRGDRPVEFAYLAPFEVDQMGARSLYLWVLVPDDRAVAAPPVIRCDGHAVDLPAPKGDRNEIGLSDSPYPPPYPWNRQWYFPLNDTALACLAQAHVIVLEIQPPSAVPAQPTKPVERTEPVIFKAESRKGTTGFPAVQGFIAERGH